MRNIQLILAEEHIEKQEATIAELRKEIEELKERLANSRPILKRKKVVKKPKIE